jgi:hypothetical protein
MKTLKIATRKSPLALWQAEYVKSKLAHHYPDLTIELVKMTTKGDQILNSPLSKIGGVIEPMSELEEYENKVILRHIFYSSLEKITDFSGRHSNHSQFSFKYGTKFYPTISVVLSCLVACAIKVSNSVQ